MDSSRGLMQTMETGFQLTAKMRYQEYKIRLMMQKIAITNGTWNPNFAAWLEPYKNEVYYEKL